MSKHYYYQSDEELQSDLYDSPDDSLQETTCIDDTQNVDIASHIYAQLIFWCEQNSVPLLNKTLLQNFLQLLERAEHNQVNVPGKN